VDLRLVGMAAALGSAAAWAIGSILFKRLGEQLSPVAMTLAKGLASVLLLGLVMVFTGFTPWVGKTWLLLIASGIVGIAIGDTFFFAALRRLSPHTLVILLMSGQVLTALLAVLLLGESLTPLKWGGIALVVLGIGIVIWEKSQDRSSWQGIVLGLLAVACMSGSILLAKLALNETATVQETIQATALRMAAGTIGIGLFGWYSRGLSRWTEPFRDRQLLRRFLLAVMVVTFGGFWLSLVAIRYVEVSIASTLNATEPLFILPLSALFLGERITRQALLGTAIAIAGIVPLCQ
jgi:drug/metabolite transporter (DMT)-like permease